jgi:hypothetical protein
MRASLGKASLPRVGSVDDRPVALCHTEHISEGGRGFCLARSAHLQYFYNMCI